MKMIFWPSVALQVQQVWMLASGKNTKYTKETKNMLPQPQKTRIYLAISRSVKKEKAQAWNGKQVLFSKLWINFGYHCPTIPRINSKSGMDAWSGRIKAHIHYDFSF